MPCLCRGATEGMPPAAFEPIAEQLLTVCGHLFQRLPLHRATTSQPERFRNSPSKVVLLACLHVGGEFCVCLPGVWGLLACLQPQLQHMPALQV